MPDQYVIAATEHAERYLPGPPRDRIYRDIKVGAFSGDPGRRPDGRRLESAERKGGRLEVELEPFVDLAGRKAEGEAERLAAWFGLRRTAMGVTPSTVPWPVKQRSVGAIIRRALAVLGVLGVVATVLRIRGRGGVPAPRRGMAGSSADRTRADPLLPMNLAVVGSLRLGSPRRPPVGFQRRARPVGPLRPGR